MAAVRLSSRRSPIAQPGADAIFGIGARCFGESLRIKLTCLVDDAAQPNPGFSGCLALESSVFAVISLIIAAIV